METMKANLLEDYPAFLRWVSGIPKEEIEGQYMTGLREWMEREKNPRVQRELRKREAEAIKWLSEQA